MNHLLNLAALLLLLVISTVLAAEEFDLASPDIPDFDKTQITTAYRQFTVISPRSGARYASAPMLKVYLPQRDEVIFTLIRCAGPDQRQPCDHDEGNITPDDFNCASDQARCTAEMPFGFELPYEKHYSLHIRPKSSRDLLQVDFEMGTMAEQLDPAPVAKQPLVTGQTITKQRVGNGIFVVRIEQITESLRAGQSVDLLGWLENRGAATSAAGLKYSVVCEVLAGDGECPLKDAAHTVDAQIEPGAMHAVKLTGSVAAAGTYAVTLAAPLPEKGEPFTGNSVTLTFQVLADRMPIERARIKRDPN